MITRNEKIEAILKSWLTGLDIATLDKKELALAAGAAIELAKATDDEVYSNFAIKVADMCKDTLEGDSLANLKIASTFYYAATKTGDATYVDAAKKAAGQLNTQPRSAEGVFLCGDKDVCICQAYMSQAFYMKYETANGGKERYNDIIAQYNTYRANYYDAVVAKVSEDVCAAKAVALYAASLIDTMEVAEQPVYEIFRRMQDLFKEAVNAMINAGVYDNCDVAAVMASYDVLKGCRMKALHTEKYEAIGLKVLDAAISTAEAQDKSAELDWMAALAMSYSESLKNREYQDYGRGKGGALWS